MTKMVPLAIAACTVAAAAVTFVPSQAQNSSTATVGTGSDPAALPDQELGRRFMVKADWRISYEGPKRQTGRPNGTTGGR